MSFLIFLADTVDSITPDKVRGLRDMLNSSAMDIMYYTSPLYRDEVSLQNLLLGGKTCIWECQESSLPRKNHIKGVNTL